MRTLSERFELTTAAPQDYWDQLYEQRALTYNPKEVLFKDLFKQFLIPGGKCFEVGCYPGSFLIYLSREFSYEVSGIDATPNVTKLLPDHFRKHGAIIGELLHGDFLSMKTTQTYDVVCSFGFIEHFFNYEEVIERHIDLLADHGTLIISCPNFRRIQFLLHRLIDNTNLNRHVLESMDFASWNKVLARRGLRVLYQQYYRTAGFWACSRDRAWLAALAAGVLRYMAIAVDRSIRSPNRFTSPFMITIARRN